MSWDEVEEQLTLPRLIALTVYWEVHPPTHLLLAGFVGFKPKEPEKSSGSMLDFIRDIGGLQPGTVVIDEKARKELDHGITR